jgi:hypothetical protein
MTKPEKQPTVASPIEPVVMWISAFTSKPKDGEIVLVKFGDGEVTAGYIAPEYGTHEAHGEKWPVWNTVKESNVFGVEFYAPLPK